MKDCTIRTTRKEFIATGICAGAYCAIPGQASAETPTRPDLFEARYYEKANNQLVKCKLCPWKCNISKGGLGKCRVKINHNGKLYSLVYGKPCAMNLDPIEKKPFFHVYPGTKAFSIATAGCNFVCKFCQNWDISQIEIDKVNVPYQSPQDIAQKAANAQAKTIAYTYSEPTIFNEYVVDCAKAAKDLGIESIVVSNGFICSEPLKDLTKVVKAIKVDFKAFTDDFYENTCEGLLDPVKKSLKTIVESGTWLEIVVLVIPTLNDNMDDIKKMADWIIKELGPDVPLHFTRFHPAYKLQNLTQTPPAILANARATAMKQGCNYVYTGNLPGNDGENTYCPKCKTMVIKRYGMMTMSNGLNGNNCPNCGNHIPGIWN